MKYLSYNILPHELNSFVWILCPPTCILGSHRPSRGILGTSWPPRSRGLARSSPRS